MNNIKIVNRKTVKIFVILIVLFIQGFLATAQNTGNEFAKPILTNKTMETQKPTYGIVGNQAPELSNAIEWIDRQGNEMTPIQLSDHQGKIKVIYGFQSWCPGCHSRGLPALKKMVDALSENDQVVFFAIQTVFEGFHINTKDKLLETLQKYQLNIPFGHDVGSEKTNNRSSTTYHYKTGGTPWFIFIDQNNQVVFNDFHLDVDKAIEYLTQNNN